MTASSIDPETPPGASHRLRVERLRLLGGGRDLSFGAGLNFVHGDITTGKTTLVRLLRAFLAKIPSGLAPETASVRALSGEVVIGNDSWRIHRPLAHGGNDAPVSLAQVTGRDRLGETLRLPTSGDPSYSTTLLQKLDLPVVNVPRARTDPAGSQTPVTMSDWLGYCIIPGDEIDAEVFGSENPWRNQKRRWVFELVYGYYDVSALQANAELRSIELRLESLMQRQAIIEEFIAQNVVSIAPEELAERRAQLEAELESVRGARVQAAEDGVAAEGAGQLRERIQAERRKLDAQRQERERLGRQLRDLRDLRKQLVTQRDRLTRAIVSEEWLVDFDFVVCPRCGTGVTEERAPLGHCYVCLQEPTSGLPQESLLQEQERIVSQVAETDEVIASREQAYKEAIAAEPSQEELINELGAELDRAMRSYVSEQAYRIAERAAAEARLLASLEQVREQQAFAAGRQSNERELEKLQARRDELAERAESLSLERATPDEHKRALEERMYEYLTSLHVPQLGEFLTVKINDATYLPEISGRSFDELSSQGLKTLVNIAHALAHHTVAIDRELPLPGFLVLDGISANAGRDDYDQSRVNDVYALLESVAERYGESLQIIVVDNDLPAGATAGDPRVRLSLSQDSRLILHEPPRSDEETGSADRGAS